MELLSRFLNRQNKVGHIIYGCIFHRAGRNNRRPYRSQEPSHFRQCEFCGIRQSSLNIGKKEKAVRNKVAKCGFGFSAETFTDCMNSVIERAYDVVFFCSIPVEIIPFDLIEMSEG